MNFDRKRGLSLSKIKAELDELKENSNPKQQKIAKNERIELSAVQKMLILDYMGLLERKFLRHPDTKTSELLAVVLERTPKKIKDTLTYKDGKGVQRDKIRSRDNLQKILPYFEKLKMEDVVERINLDIDKINEE